MKWYMKYFKWITIDPDANYQVMQYKFYDKNDDEIRLN